MAILFGFPGAGAGRSVFEIWQKKLEPDLTFKEILYNRNLAAPCCRTMEEAAERCVSEVLSACWNEEKLYFFGHCMGAAVAYETAKRLAVNHGISIQGLFISAFTSPDVPIEDGISHLDDTAFAKEIRSHGTFPDEFFVNPAILKLFLPRIRADYRLIEEYQDQEGYVLDCPFAGFFGREDESVTEDGIRNWSSYTSCGFRKYYFPGNHYFYYDHQEEIIETIRERIGKYRNQRSGGAN